MNWVIPCNEKLYNHKDAFDTLEYVDWKQSTNIDTCDIVYVYVGRPSSCLMYKCYAQKVDMNECDDNDAQYNLGEYGQDTHHRWMRLVLLEKYPEEKFPKDELIAHGLKTVQGPCKVDENFVKYIDEKR